jgi:hypothetical protein
VSICEIYGYKYNILVLEWIYICYILNVTSVISWLAKQKYKTIQSHNPVLEEDFEIIRAID